MSTQPATPATPSLGVAQAVLRGRVDEVRRTENTVRTILKTPAPDSFSHPGQHEVLSSRLIGKPGEDVTIRVQLGGYARTFQDKTGERIRTVDNILRVIED